MTQIGNTAQNYGDDLLRFIEQIVDEAGPRLAGSPGEGRAAGMIATALEPYVDEVGVDVVTAKLRSPVSVLRFALWSCFVAALLLLILPELGVALTLAAYLMVLLCFRYGFDPLAVLSKKSKVTNVVAVKKATKSGGRPLVIVAHHDTARANHVFVPAMEDFFTGLHRGVLPVASGLFVTAVIAIWLPEKLRVIPVVVYLLLWDWLLLYVLLLNSRRISTGANDNLSGCSVLVAAARELDSCKIDSMEIWFVSFGGTEAGNAGAKAFIEQHRGKLEDARVVVVEGVGCGEGLSVVTREKLRGIKYEQAVVDLIVAGGKSAGVKILPRLAEVGSGDAAILHRAGFAVGMLCGYRTDERYSMLWHPHDDEPDSIEQERLVDALAAVLGIVNCESKK
jgi:Peptidase family M28